MNGSLPGSSVYGIFQATELEWVAISFSRGSSRPRGWTHVSRITGRHFTVWATKEAQKECETTHKKTAMTQKKTDVNKKFIQKEIKWSVTIFKGCLACVLGFSGDAW